MSVNELAAIEELLANRAAQMQQPPSAAGPAGQRYAGREQSTWTKNASSSSSSSSWHGPSRPSSSTATANVASSSRKNSNMLRMLLELDRDADSSAASASASTSSAPLDHQAQKEICSKLGLALSGHDVIMALMASQKGGPGGGISCWAGPRQYSNVREAAADAAETLGSKADLLRHLSNERSRLSEVRWQAGCRVLLVAPMCVRRMLSLQMCAAGAAGAG
jgi:hypothetical protein